MQSVLASHVARCSAIYRSSGSKHMSLALTQLESVRCQHRRASPQGRSPFALSNRLIDQRAIHQWTINVFPTGKDPEGQG